MAALDNSRAFLYCLFNEYVIRGARKSTTRRPPSNWRARAPHVRQLERRVAGEPPGHVHPHHHRQGATWHLRRRLSLCYACEAGRPGAFASLARWRTRRAGRRPIRGGYWKTQATISNSPRAVRAVIPVPARAPARVPAGAAAAARVLVAVPMVPATVWAAATAAAPGAAAAAAAGAGAGPAVVRLVRAAPVPAVPASAERDRRVLHRRPLRAGGRALLASGHDSPPTAGYPARRRMRPIEEALAERYPRARKR